MEDHVNDFIVRSQHKAHREQCEQTGRAIINGIEFKLDAGLPSARVSRRELEMFGEVDGYAFYHHDGQPMGASAAPVEHSDEFAHISEGIKAGTYTEQELLAWAAKRFTGGGLAGATAGASAGTAHVSVEVQGTVGPSGASSTESAQTAPPTKGAKKDAAKTAPPAAPSAPAATASTSEGEAGAAKTDDQPDDNTDDDGPKKLTDDERGALRLSLESDRADALRTWLEGHRPAAEALGLSWTGRSSKADLLDAALKVLETL